MTARTAFARDYAEARRRFREAARGAGARLDAHRHPLPGPRGEALATDVAWLGPPEAERVLVTVSATHGIEGFCGSGVQVAWLEGGLARELPAGTAHLLIHAINPFGFAWLRRVTEDNVDLNRNFVDHDAPYPANPGYEALAEALCPPEWTDAAIAESHKVLEAYAEAHGRHALQQAVSAGQYTHPAGIFFGGHAPSWSRRVLEAVLRAKLAAACRVAVIDVHTGLGPFGHGERICVHPPGSAALARATAWYDDDVTSPALGTSASVELAGVNEIGMEQALAHAELTAVALEFGTLPLAEVSLALRADNWLHVHGDPETAKGRAIKEQIQAAFYPEAAEWRDMVWQRALETLRQAVRGLSDS